MSCAFCVSLQGVPRFLRHSHQTSVDICQILVFCWWKNGCLWSLSSSHLEPLNCVSMRFKWLQISLMNVCLFLSCYSFQIFLALSCLVLRVASGPRVKLASCKSALNPRWFTLLTVLRRWFRCYSYSLLLCGLFYVGFLFLLVSGKSCGLWLWLFLDFSLTFFCSRRAGGMRRVSLLTTSLKSVQ